MRQVINIARGLRLAAQFAWDNYPGRALHRQAARLLEELLPGELARHQPGSAEARVLLKMKWYTISGLWVCRMFNDLAGTWPTQEEKLRYACISGMMAVNDYMVDDMQGARPALARMADEPGWSDAQKPITALNARLYARLQALSPKALWPEISLYLHKGWLAQMDTHKQFDPQLTLADTDALIRDKCGYMTLMYRCLTAAPMQPGEAEMVYETGALIQMINDVNDLWKDAHAGMRTSATVCASLPHMLARIQQQRDGLFACVQALPYPAPRLAAYRFIFHGFVAGVEANMRQYAQLCGGAFSWEKFMALERKKARPNPLRPASLMFAMRRAAAFRPGD